jgi:hypothetical protein
VRFRDLTQPLQLREQSTPDGLQEMSPQTSPCSASQKTGPLSRGWDAHHFEDEELDPQGKNPQNIARLGGSICLSLMAWNPQGSTLKKLGGPLSSE